MSDSQCLAESASRSFYTLCPRTQIVFKYVAFYLLTNRTGSSQNVQLSVPPAGDDRFGRSQPSFSVLRRSMKCFNIHIKTGRDCCPCWRWSVLVLIPQLHSIKLGLAGSHSRGTPLAVAVCRPPSPIERINTPSLWLADPSNRRRVSRRRSTPNGWVPATTISTTTQTGSTCGWTPTPLYSRSIAHR